MSPVLIIIQAGVLCKWTNDTQRFLLEHFDAIHDSPSQIYYFALPFSPSTSWLQKCYSAELPNGVKVVRGLPLGWGTCSRTVSLNVEPQTISCWNNTVAVCLQSSSIIILNAVTGSQTAVFSGHTSIVTSSTFSQDGILFVSGSYDMTVKLWDVQTGGVIKTFFGHKDRVMSVSISTNSAMIASGDNNGMIYLWDIRTWECCCTIKQERRVDYVNFSPINPQYLTSISDHKVWQWDINGHQVGPTYDGSHIAFSLDGTQFVLCNEDTVTIQHSDTRTAVAKFNVKSRHPNSCCFSPDGKLVAVATSSSTYVWDTTSFNSHPIESFIRQAGGLSDLIFSSPSTLISASRDKSVRFWQIGVSLTDPTISDQKSTPIASAPIKSISLNPRNGVVISSCTNGIVKTWDILTGLCRATFQTPASGSLRDVQLVDGKLILVWHESEKIHIWDTEKGELLQTVEVPDCQSLKISGDGSKIFCLNGFTTFEAWSIWTGEPMGKVELEGDSFGNFFYLDGPKIWIELEDSSIQGWDFGTSDSSPVLLPNIPLESSCLELLKDPPRIRNKVTGKVVFQLFGMYAGPKVAQWDGQYLVAGYETGEVLILDFCHLYPQQDSIVYCLCEWSAISW